MSSTGMQTLAEIVERFQHRHVPVMLCGMRPNLFETLRSVGTIDLVGESNVSRDMTEIAQRISSAG